MLIATHEMGFAREVADRVGFLHEGQLVEIGPPEQVLGEPARARDEAVPAAPAGGRPGLSELTGGTPGYRGRSSQPPSARPAAWRASLRSR